ncbi:MAG: PKD domain-containing protein [Bacteroidota bacterium]|nr:PKD domain-containing protein [Bacteroidota bacterium]MDX5449306.1 PKD domain-containing protein [Bacteroidota bacterium]
MKFYLSFAFSLVFFFGFSQTDSLILRPNSLQGKDAMIWSVNGNSNYGNSPDAVWTAWTYSGSPSIKRFLLEFDLSSLPMGTIIDSAILFLYNNPTASSHNGQHSGSNQFNVRRLTSSWSESVVNFNNQPTSTGRNEVVVPATVSNSQDFKVQVGSMVQEMIDSSNYGFLLKMDVESPYRAIVCASSDHTDPNLRPMLKIYYQSCLNPNADFSFQRQGNTLNFFDSTSIFVGASYHWDFGDGTFSTLQNPTKTYGSAGPFTVCLTVNDSCGSDTTCKVIDFCQPKQVSYQHTSTGRNVQFTASPNNALSYLWDFGDGNMSYQKNPNYTFSQFGNHKVCLMVTDTCTIDTFCQNIVLSSVGISENFKDQQISIYPNPNNGEQLFIPSLSDIVRIEFFDSLGRLIQCIDTPGSSNPVPLPYLENGSYLIRLWGPGSNVRFSKVIILH